MNRDDAATDVAVVIADDVDVRDQVGAVLGRLGFDIVNVSGGYDGVVAIGRHRPRLTVIDRNITDIDSVSATLQVRALSPTLIAIVSGESHEASVVAALSAGADCYIPAPFSPRVFRARVSALLRRTSASRPLVPLAGGSPNGSRPVPTRTRAAAPPPIRRRTPAAADPSTLVPGRRIVGPGAVPPVPQPAPVAAEVAPEPVLPEPVVPEPVAPEPVVPEPVVLPPEPEPKPAPAKPAVRKVAAPKPVEPKAPAPKVAKPKPAPRPVAKPVSKPVEPKAVEPTVAAPKPKPKPKPVEPKAVEPKAAETESVEQKPVEAKSKPKSKPAEPKAKPAEPTAKPEPKPEPKARRQPDATRPAADLIEMRGLVINPRDGWVKVDGRSVELSDDELQILVVLMSGARRVLSRSMLAQILFGIAETPTDDDRRAIDAVVAGLCKRLGEDAARPRWIGTVPGIGYRRTAR